MAKSLRSKWKRKCRAIKRERYGKKELDRLKKTLGIDAAQDSDNNIAMTKLSEVVTFTTVEEVKKRHNDSKDDVIGGMEVDEIKNKYHPKTLRNENGAYPVWLHPRKIKKSKKTKSKGKINKKHK